MFDWDDLRYFLAVARHGSTLAAAKALGVNQSTVHRRLMALEARIGQTLTRRHPTGYRLTEVGQALHPHVERIEEAVASFERQLAASEQALTGTIRVTCPEPLVGRITQSPLLDLFQARYPGLRVEFVMSDRFLDLSKGEADVAIRAGDLVDDVLVCRKLSDSPWALYASRSYVARHGRPNDVAALDHHLVIGFDGALADHRAARWLRTAAPNTKIVARNNSIPGLIYAVKSGLGITPLPVALGDAEQDLVCVVGPLPELATSWYLLTHPDLRQAPRIRAFFDFVVDQIGIMRPILVGGSQPRA